MAETKAKPKANSKAKETKEDPKQTSNEQNEPNLEELRKQKQELIKFYKAELPLLRLQAEYEECITRIDAAKLTRFQIMMEKAQMMAPPPGEHEDEQNQGREVGEHRIPRKDEVDPASADAEESTSKKPRTLKKA